MSCTPYTVRIDTVTLFLRSSISISRSSIPSKWRGSRGLVVLREGLLEVGLVDAHLLGEVRASLEELHDLAYSAFKIESTTRVPDLIEAICACKVTINQGGVSACVRLRGRFFSICPPSR